MHSQSEPSTPPRPSRSLRRRSGWTVRISPLGIILLAIFNLLILSVLALGISRVKVWTELVDWLNEENPTVIPSSTIAQVATTTPTSTRQPSSTSTEQPTGTFTPEPPTASPQPISTLSLNQGLIILALDEGGNTHLFAYQPAEVGAGQPLPLTRLTYGPWDDINPMINADGTTVAFASNRTGYWDIYTLDLRSGTITRMTNSLEYEAAPAWSPDNKWLVYEAYENDNLEIKIQSVMTTSETIMLTDDPAADFSPAWSPEGRRIAFVSNRSGEDEIWLADLDKGEEERFSDISLNPGSSDTHPAWSPDGKSLLWVGEQDGVHSLFSQLIPFTDELNNTLVKPPRQNLGNGDWPAWSSDGETVLTTIETPNRVYLTAYPAHVPGLALPTLELPGSVEGISWGRVGLSSTDLLSIYQPAAQLTVTPLYVTVLTSQPDENGGRFQLSALGDIEAPDPYLHDAVDENFRALRARIATESGWDFLSTLENAYVPLTTPLDPGMGNDWLYTGRAFAFNTLSLNAGWLMVVRENYGSDTYWRVFIKARYQDGSAGIPLHALPWNFDARYSGDTIPYEQGGTLQAGIPSGYWIDFTERALSYGWERLPALTTWRAFYPAARFNEFVITDGMNWQSAMFELYPPEALITPSPVTPPTRTVSPTSRWYVSPTPTDTPTFRPTFTPAPETPTSYPLTYHPYNVPSSRGG